MLLDAPTNIDAIHETAQVNTEPNTLEERNDTEEDELILNNFLVLDAMEEIGYNNGNKTLATKVKFS